MEMPRPREQRDRQADVDELLREDWILEREQKSAAARRDAQKVKFLAGVRASLKARIDGHVEDRPTGC